MKAIVFINKTLGLIVFPLVLYYIFTGYERTPKMGYVFYPELLGFWNDGMVSEGRIDFLGLCLGVLSVVMFSRYIRFLMTIKETNSQDLAKDSSENISNILDIIYAYMYINLTGSISYVDNKIPLMILCVVLTIIFVVWKIFEGSASSDGATKGAFNIRESLADYYYRKSNYTYYKEVLNDNYKKAIS